jgi:hypothetical protein
MPHASIGQIVSEPSPYQHWSYAARRARLRRPPPPGCLGCETTSSSSPAAESPARPVETMQAAGCQALPPMKRSPLSSKPVVPAAATVCHPAAAVVQSTKCQLQQGAAASVCSSGHCSHQQY